MRNHSIYELNGKKILLVLPKYFSYEITIMNCLKNRGANIYHIYENAEEINYFYRLIYRYVPSKRDMVMNIYYDKFLSSLPSSIDFVFIIRGSSITSSTMNKIRNKYPKAYYVMYQWDSVKNNARAKEIARYFDKVLTFDIVDAKQYGWEYRPLFFTEGINNEKKDIDVSYICSIHSERIQILNKLKDICNKKGIDLFTYVFSNKMIFFKRKYISHVPEYIIADKNDIKFVPLSTSATETIYKRSKVVVDYTNPNQTGFTMRTIECIGNRCKLITNNKEILNADFYTPNNFYVYDGLDIAIPETFLNTEYQEMDSSKLKFYSLDGWIDSIFLKKYI